MVEGAMAERYFDFVQKIPYKLSAAGLVELWFSFIFGEASLILEESQKWSFNYKNEANAYFFDNEVTIYMNVEV